MKRALIAVLLLILASGAGAQQPQAPLPAPSPLPRPTPQPYFYTAQTEQPVRRSGAVLASGINWRCAGSACTVSGPWPQPGVGACAALAREIGRINSYGRPGAALTTAQLTQCNAESPTSTSSTPPPPVDPGIGLRAPPTALNLTNFAAASAQCTTGPQSATVDFTVALRPVASQVSGNTASVETIVDGRSLGVQTLPVERTPSISDSGPLLIRVARRLTVTFPNGTRRVQFVVNHAYRSAEQTIAYNCLSLAPNQNTVRPMEIVRPDLAIHPIVIAIYTPIPPDDGCYGHGRDWGGECRLVLGPRFTDIPTNALIVSDLSRPIPLYRIVQPSCPTERDAYATVTFYLGFESSGLDDASPYLGERDYTRSYDARLTTVTASPGYASLPVGHQWFASSAIIPCRRVGTFEYRLDPLNRLNESNENNNVIRFNYSAVQ